AASQGLSAAPHPHLPQSRHGPARGRVPRDPVEDRGGLGNALGEGVPAGYPEPSELPSRTAHRLHLLGVRGRVGVRGHDRPDDPLPGDRSPLPPDRVPCPRPLRGAARAGDGRHDLLAGGHQRRNDHRAHAGRRDPAALLQLRGFVAALSARGHGPGDERFNAALLLLGPAPRRTSLRAYACPLTIWSMALTSWALAHAPTICSFT